MENAVRVTLMAWPCLVAGITVASCQTNQSSAQSPGDEIKAGAQHVGEGASRIGEGIKQGAIQTWEAVKTGAESAAAKLKGEPATSPQSAPSDSPGTSH